MIELIKVGVRIINMELEHLSEIAPARFDEDILFQR
jgi:hypothetical protein